jgi:hypothetical protein
MKPTEPRECPKWQVATGCILEMGTGRMVLQVFSVDSQETLRHIVELHNGIKRPADPVKQRLTEFTELALSLRQFERITPFEARLLLLAQEVDRQFPKEP